jgi:hypothetical protein
LAGKSHQSYTLSSYLSYHVKSRRIFFVGLVVLALVLSVSILVGFQLYEGAVEERQASDVAQSADYVQSEMDARLSGHQGSAELWAQNPSLGSHGGADQRTALVSFVNTTEFSGASVIAANGTMTNIVAGLSDRQRRNLVGSDFGDREYFQRAMAGETYVSEPVEAESGNYIITGAVSGCGSSTVSSHARAGRCPSTRTNHGGTWSGSRSGGDPRALYCGL